MPSVRAQPGIEPATSVCALTGHQACNLLVQRVMCPPTEPPNQGSSTFKLSFLINTIKTGGRNMIRLLGTDIKVSIYILYALLAIKVNKLITTIIKVETKLIVINCSLLNCPYHGKQLAKYMWVSQRVMLKQFGKNISKFKRYMLFLMSNSTSRNLLQDLSPPFYKREWQGYPLEPHLKYPLTEYRRLVK